jgi:hypothetical protein
MPKKYFKKNGNRENECICYNYINIFKSRPGTCKTQMCHPPAGMAHLKRNALLRTR